jgi:MFS family permease
MTAPAPSVWRDHRAWAVFTVFFIEAFAFASWLPRLPEMKTAFGLGEGDLGLVLLGLPVGALLVMPVAGWSSTRLSVRRLNLICMTWLYAAIALIGFAPSAAGLTSILFLLGLGTGSMGVAMNAAGIAAEAAIGRPILSRCHAFFSLGLAGGGAAAGLFVALGMPIPVHLGAVTAGLFVILLIALRGVSDAAPPASEDDTPRVALPTGALLVPALIALACLLAEGAALDWSPIYLAEDLGASGMLVGAGVTAFAGAMAAARFAGDLLSDRFGDRALVTVGVLLAAVGYGVVAIADLASGGAPVIALAGFVTLGFGLAPVVPVAFRAAARLSPRAPGAGVAAVSTLGYVGFLLGPALVGLAAEAASLAAAFAAIAVLLVGAGGLARRLAA